MYYVPRERRCEFNSASCVKIKLCLFSEQAKLNSNRSTISVALSSRIWSSIPAQPCLQNKMCDGVMIELRKYLGPALNPRGRILAPVKPNRVETYSDTGLSR